MAVKKISTPSVVRSEIDQSESVAPAGTSTGAIVIRSTQGPINYPVLVSTISELYDTFGKPVFTSGCGTLTPTQQPNVLAGIPDNGYGLYAAAQFLNESNALYVSRAVESSDKFAALYFKSTYDYTSTATSAYGTSGIGAQSYVAGTQFDRADYNSSIETSGAPPTNYNFTVAALDPGLKGNNVAVSLETFSSGCDWVYKYDGFPTSGGTSALATTQVIAKKIVRIDVYVKDTVQTWPSIVYDVGQKQTQTATSALSLRELIAPTETFYCTMTPQLDHENRQMQASSVINGNSKFIYVKTSNPASDFNVAAIQNPTPYLSASALLALGGGVVDPAATGLGDGSDQASLLAAWSVFQSREFIPNINLLLNCDWNTVIKQRVAQIAATRMDCLAFGQAGDPSNLTVASILSQEQYGYTNPSYMALYAGYDKIYDDVNDKYFYIPKAAFGPAICARTDNVANTWEAPAGQARGIIPSIGQRIMFTNAQIGQMYDRNINTSTTQPGLGTYLLGQKTAQLKNTYLSRINVRRDLLYIENSIEPMLNAFLFELNNDRTRQRITANVDSFLSDVMAAGGLVNKMVVCNSENNTADVINNNQLYCDIYCQPPTCVEFIIFRTIVSKAGVSFARV